MWFHRLAIMDLSPAWHQPFELETDDEYIYWTCNWEIYNHKALESELRCTAEEYNLSTKLRSHSDCECIWHIYSEVWFEDMIKKLDWEFAIAMIVVDKKTWTDKLYLGRDPYGVRPLFVWHHDDNTYRCSEMKWLVDICSDIKPFVPWSYMTICRDKSIACPSDNISNIYKYFLDNSAALCGAGGNFLTLQNGGQASIHEEKQALVEIKDKLYDAVAKRLVSDRPLGCLLSGWLDSSLVCGIAAKLSNQPIHTFTIWLEWWSDIIYAESVAKYIWSKHTTFVVTIKEALEAIDHVIYQIETWDTTTIRASVWQYLIGKYISAQTDIKVILTGEWSDEMSGGYMYFHNTPSAQEFDAECHRLLKDIYMYDGLRVDRSMATHGLEVRIPLLDPQLTKTYLSIDSTLRMPKTYWIEKYLLRKAFEEDAIIPSEVLWRKKEAFSDGVSQQTKSWFEIIQDKIDTIISDQEFEEFLDQRDNLTIQNGGKTWSSNCKPDTKEKYYYYKKFVEYFGEDNLWVINYYRMPKWSWNTKDPSARVLDVYKK
jgi:asparagine synthase (glutamine-hydrolysing)